MREKPSVDGKEYWRSLNELADTPEFRDFLDGEFPAGTADIMNTMTRRNFISLMGASLAFAGLASCRRPVEKIIPYVAAPEEIVPGIARRYATTMPFGCSAYGLLVESHEGRPTKIEGNKDHPSSMGLSNVMIQASILGLYDPDRSQSLQYKGQKREWSDFVFAWGKLYESYASNKGRGLAILSESYSSPSLARMMKIFDEKFPEAKRVIYEPISDENVFEGIRIATGRNYRPMYHFERAEVILSLDSDFLNTGSESIINAKGFADGRRIESENNKMNRLYVVESVYSLTGGMADHRMRLESGRIGTFVITLTRELKSQGLDLDIPDSLMKYGDGGFDDRWIHAAAKDLIAHRGKSLVLAGYRQPPGIHALIFAINNALGNVGNTVGYLDFKDSGIPNRSELSALIREISDGNINTLVIVSGNPVYNAPVDLHFDAALEKVEHSIHLSPYVDETSVLAEWHVNQAHFLESWGDARSADGTPSIIQPLIEPLFGGRSPLEILQLIVRGEELSGYEIVRDTWRGIINSGNFEKRWNRVLHDGLLRERSITESAPGLKSKSITKYIRENPLRVDTGDPSEMEIVFCPSPSLFDGRFANNGWLQELPDPLTKLTWDNAAVLSPALAGGLKLKNGDIALLEYKDRRLEMPVWIQPGQADNSVSLTLGYGRESVGRIGNGVGFNVYTLRTLHAPDFDIGLKLTKTGRTYDLATTQDHSSMEGRPLIRETTLDRYRNDPDFAQGMVEHFPQKSLWKEHSYDEGYQWGMTIDLNLCIGCNACTVACQSENNIPIVGKEQVAMRREMHWLRVDRYFEGNSHDPGVLYQPVGCQHCEMAPCEQVCPVAATTHNREGLNTMVYNRCVGTRYCSNNCPYKVRRFNFFNFTKEIPEIVKMAQNPDVTVRSRGVMEKCTYCLQRISGAKINAKVEGRRVRDGEILTACQQSCPTGAIAFGDINDPESKVSRMKRQNRNYGLLAGFNTRPRTSYLARIRNPNPEFRRGKNRAK